MASFQFEMVTPEKLLFSGVVGSVVVPGTEGDFEVLAQHAPLMSTMRPGLIMFKDETGTSKRLFVLGGFAEVNPNGLTILAEQAIDFADFNAERLNAAVKDAEDAVKNATGPDELSLASQRLEQLRDFQLTKPS